MRDLKYNMTEEKHIIYKVDVDIDVPDMSAARRMYDRVPGLLNDEVLPYIESVLKQMENSSSYYRADTMNIQLSFDTEEQFYNDFPVKAVNDFSKKIAGVVNGRKAGHTTKALADDFRFEHIDEEHKRKEVFFYFLKTGCLPWYASFENDWLNEADLQRQIEQYTAIWKEAFIDCFRQDEIYVKRFVRQFSSEFISSIGFIFSGVDFERLEKEVSFVLMRREAISIRAIKQLFGEKLLVAIFVNKKEVHEKELLKEITEQIVMHPAISENEKKSLIKKAKAEINEDGVFISHAGLIILHPYLLYFFKELGLLENEDFKDQNARQTAIHLLHYLATGLDHPFEYDLLFEKYLCGLPIDEPVERFVELTPRMKEESDEMLKAVVHHWKILKGTSPDGLREGFLQRSGKLIIKSFQHRLIIENNSIDILLDHLPWGYSVVSLPWLEKILYVDWRNN